MKLKKHLKCTAVLSVLCAGMMFPMAVQADPEYQTMDVTTYLYDGEHTTEMTLAFKENLPTIPYIRVTDYLNTVYKADDFTASFQQDGTYRIASAASEYSMTVDPNEDTVTFPEYNDFISQATNVASDMDVTFVNGIDSGYVGGAKQALFNLRGYNIDILEINGNVYLPLPTMNDLFMRLYNAAQYLDGKLYFLHSSDLVSGSCYFDRASLYDRLVRPESEAQFNYNELCLMMDTSYGAPTRGKLAEKILEVGFDEALESSEKLQKAKAYLQSENLVDYNIGLFYLGDDVFDGGHMAPVQDVNSAIQNYPQSPLISALLEVFNDQDRVEDREICMAYAEELGLRDGLVAQVTQEKVKTVLAQYTAVNSWEDCGAELYVAGDTAFFTFNQFTIPVVEAFKWSVDKAEELGLKNFVVDLSTNSGGVTHVACYMLALMTNSERKTNEFTTYSYYRASDETAYQTVALDLNLDGQFTDADKEVAYDLNFAVLETGCSFSSGNLMPVLAKEMGIAVLGENSGGGGCALIFDFTASGYYMNISGMPKFMTENPDTDVDLGAKPDYELAYDEMFDAKLLSTKIHEFYGDYKNEWVSGKWYDKNGAQTYAPKADWKKVGKNWTYVDEDGWFPKNRWQKIDGAWYFFDKDGLMEADAYREGCYLTETGAWDGNAKVTGWKKDDEGWWYSLGGKDYLQNGWTKIDGKWYYFKEDGYAAQSEFVQGWWCDKNCVQSDPVKYGWHNYGSKWWYGVKGGWYAKNAAYTIDGESCSFDKSGYFTED